MNQDISTHPLIRIITFLDRVRQLAILFDHKFNLIATTQFASDSTEIEKLQHILSSTSNPCELKQSGGMVLETKAMDGMLSRNWEVIPIRNNFLLLGEIHAMDEQDKLSGRKLIESITGKLIYDDYSNQEYINIIKHHYEQILNQLPNYIYWKSRAGYYLGLNHSLSKLLAQNKIQDIIGLKDSHITFVNNLKSFFTGDEADVLAGMPIHDRCLTVETREQILTLSVNKYPLYSKDMQVVGILGVAIDVTDVKCLQTANGEQQSINRKLQKIIDDMIPRH